MLEKHDLTIRANGFVEMAYVGALPWHQLGNPVQKGISIDEMRVQSGLDWDALTSTVQYHNEDGLLLPMESRKVIYRSDTFKPVGLVGQEYQVVGPADILESFRDQVESGGWYIHTAGSMRGGAKIWVMASREDLKSGTVVGRDKVLPHLLAATSLDGSMKTTYCLTAIRGVCANTIRMAIASATGGDKVTISHRSVFDPEAIKDSLGVSLASFERFMLDAKRLAKRAIKLDEARVVLRSLFGQPTEKEIKTSSQDYSFQRLMSQFSKAEDGKKLTEQRSVSRVLTLFAGEGLGADMPGSAGTRWGLLNAVTQHIDHERGRSDDTRMESAWFGAGNDIKTEALDLLTADLD